MVLCACVKGPVPWVAEVRKQLESGISKLAWKIKQNPEGGKEGKRQEEEEDRERRRNRMGREAMDELY